MKTVLLLTTILFAFNSFGQTPSESNVVKLSNQIFHWEVEGRLDSLAAIFDDKFVVVGSSGESQTKPQYLTRLRSGNFIHNSIDVQKDSAMVSNNTAIVVGQGIFTVTVNGKKVTLPLSYIEVFTRPVTKAPWKVLAMHASRLQN